MAMGSGTRNSSGRPERGQEIGVLVNEVTVEIEL